MQKTAGFLLETAHGEEPFVFGSKNCVTQLSSAQLS
jgi:hypothetical protein